jgi:hypothetical protein
VEPTKDASQVSRVDADGLGNGLQRPVVGELGD